MYQWEDDEEKEVHRLERRITKESGEKKSRCPGWRNSRAEIWM